ncbi:unnamed protein product [Ectocarpus sp. CCAP 1310/34]|nr:unnamed protein product [Ectocarpus sp. CCAP 1310/34]
MPQYSYRAIVVREAQLWIGTGSARSKCYVFVFTASLVLCFSDCSAMQIGVNLLVAS